jgi:23S rRNA (adenine2503-C2)-methyltransferase
MNEPLYGKSHTELGDIAATLDLPAYAASQLARWVYARGARSFDDMHDLPRRARDALAGRYTVEPQVAQKVTVSADGTRKYLFPAADGLVEAACIPDRDRATLCLSVQVGCKMGCLFCMTGKQGFRGNLDPAAIVNQYRALPERERVTNIVYMGMGEPLDNLENVLTSLEIFTSPWGYGMSPTRITVSTVGLLPALPDFLERSACHLAVSLHTPFEEERRTLMPVENVYPLREILAAIRAHARGRQRRVSFEYIAFDGVNDTERHARELARILDGIRCRINLIPFHPIPGSPLAPSPRHAMERFQGWLMASGLRTTIRQSRGLDIAAACGLLSTRELLRGRRPDNVSTAAARWAILGA